MKGTMVKERKRHVYLDMKTLDEAAGIWKRATGLMRTGTEVVSAHDALGRVTAEPIFARESVPHYHGAAMDGIAVRAGDTFGASDSRPFRMVLGQTAFEVDTGDPLPENTDAVIMIEFVERVSEREVEIRSAAYPWQHVRKVGEDIVAGELLLPENHRLRPPDMGALLAAGVLHVTARAVPKVWVQPTGTELVPPERAGEAAPGRIVEFNGTVLAGMVRECGGIPVLQEIIPDGFDSVRRTLRAAVESDADVILMNAGSSAGSEDYTASAVADLGRVLVHGVTMMPGKPTILGIISGKPVVGIPGYPVSAILSFEQFVRPLLYGLQGLPTPAFPEAEVVMGRQAPSRLGLEEFVRVIVGRVEGRLVAMPLQQGAGIITSLTRADGILRIPQESEGLNADERVTVRLLRPKDQLDHTLIMIGSHDNTIDVLANELKKRDARMHLSSSNVGSLGGLLAVRRGQTHLAGSHLLETDTGDYNFAYVERHLQGKPVRLVKLAMRRQGLLLRPGNPKGIRSIEDLTRPDVTFVNRQAGSGTRILFDHYLERGGISPSAVSGYDQEEFTHMAVAVSVLSGRADAGMAIFSSARALGLEFIPFAEERYDLVIPESGLSDPKIEVLMDTIASKSFKSMVADLGGYDVRDAGAVMGVWDGRSWVERAQRS